MGGTFRDIRTGSERARSAFRHPAHTSLSYPDSGQFSRYVTGYISILKIQQAASAIRPYGATARIMASQYLACVLTPARNAFAGSGGTYRRLLVQPLNRQIDPMGNMGNYVLGAL